MIHLSNAMILVELINASQIIPANLGMKASCASSASQTITKTLMANAPNAKDLI